MLLVQQQNTKICVTGSGPPCLGSGCTQSVQWGSGPLWLPTGSHLGWWRSGGEVTGLPMQQNHTDFSREAQHALVFGPGGHVHPDPIVPVQPAQSTDSAVQPDPSQESVKPESSCLAPRDSAIKEKGLSEAVTARIEAPQWGSTNSIYEAKWTIFTKWCNSYQMDLKAPPVKSIYLFQGRKLQPSTIDGYRSVIADKLGNSPIIVSKVYVFFTCLLDNFRDRPKIRRGILEPFPGAAPADKGSLWTP